MKSSKILMPVMAIAMAVGLAFSTKANEQQSNGWVLRNGAPYELQSNPCTSASNSQCIVSFTDDLNTEHQVFMDSDLQVEKPGGTATSDPYIIEN